MAPQTSWFGFPGQPQQQQQPVTAQPMTPQPPAPAAGGFDMNAMIQAFAQMQQQQAQSRLQGQREFIQSQRPLHMGIGGGAINPQTGREEGNAFDTGFFKSNASQLTPEQLAQSQGGNAMNQWTQAFAGSAPPQGTAAQGAVAASPPMFDVSGNNAMLNQSLMSGGNAPQAQPMQQQQQRPQPKPKPQTSGYMPSWNASPRKGFAF